MTALARPARPETRPIYLDYQATTPVDPRVLARMLPLFTEEFGNPHSTGHEFGRRAAAAVEESRTQIAELIGAEPAEIVFTSGATEANNLAIKGAARFLKGRRHRIVTVATEHKCVLEAVKDLALEGFELEILPVEPNGLVDLDRLAAALDDRTALVSVMAANNETGVLQDLAAIGRLARARGVLFHTDAAQAFGKVPLDVQAAGIDLLSISGHKVYGPKGVGALHVRRKPRVRLVPLFSGGGQERGLRSGTLAPALCVGLGTAAALCRDELDSDAERLRALARRLLSGLTGHGVEFELNGDAERRLPGSLNLAFAGVSASAVLERLTDVAISTGSACTSAEIEPSYVLRAMGLDRARAAASLRISLGRFTTEDEIDRAAERLAGVVADLRGRGLPTAFSAAT